MRKQRGLTLVELMVVLAIMAILAAVAYPLYTEQSRKTRRTEGRTALLELAQAQERFYTVNGQYAATPGALGLPAATENGYYTLNIQQPGGTGTFLATATAAGAQAGDTACTAMTLTHLGVKDGTPVANRCW